MASTKRFVSLYWQEQASDSTIDSPLGLTIAADLIQTFATPGVWSPEDLDHILMRYGAFVVERAGENLCSVTLKSKPDL